MGQIEQFFPMRFAFFLLVALASFGCGAVDRPTRAATPGGYVHGSGIATNLQLPPVPSGCIVRIYHVGPNSFPDGPHDRADWAAYFRAQGVIFPRGGFAAFFAPTSTLVVANTPDQLELLDPF
jgi:hypothetical protein